MSVAALPAPSPAAAADRRPSLGRLTLVELRKMTDTRAGFWLLLSTVLITAAAVILVVIVADAPDLSLKDMVGLAVQPASLLLPIIGILLVCSEWSQRTAMITFALVPDRSRVMVAKLLAALLLAIVAIQVAYAFAALGTAVGGGAGPTRPGWSARSSSTRSSRCSRASRSVPRCATRPARSSATS